MPEKEALTQEEISQLIATKEGYIKFKRVMDVLLSGAAIVVLSPVLGATALLIKMDSPGPVLFKQKRVGKNKEHFEIWKFRTMRTDTPKDMPTHMLSNPDAFITKTGKFLRKTSLDELPQIFNIFKGEMTIIGPRPALWNQYDLIEERDKYGANDVTSGLTGWAQINGRDELEIPVKAKFDGEYVKYMGIKRDLECFFGTIGSVLAHEGVVEGGTGEIEKEGTIPGTLPHKNIKKNIAVGAAVSVAAAAVGLTALGLGAKYISSKKKAPSNTSKSCKSLKVLGGIGVAAAAGVAAAKLRKSKEKSEPDEKESSSPEKKMKILVICQYYKPEPFRISDLCEELVKRGHEVTVLTGVPNYPEGIIYDDYKNGKNRDEVINGVKVHRCFTIGRKTGTVHRFLNYYSYAASSTLNALLDRYKPSDGSEYDVVLVNQLSPIMMAYAGMAYAKKHHKKLVMYCLDLWPESLAAGGISSDSAIYKTFYGISKHIYRSCDQILVTSRMFVDHISDSFGIDKSKIAYLPQYAEGLFDEIERKSKDKDTFDFVFAGNIGEIQSVQTIIEAAELLKGTKAVFHIVGGGTDIDRLQALTEQKSLKNVIFYGRKPVEEMPEYYAMADAMLVTLSDDKVLSLTLPGKVQSYMAAGKPVIGAINGETQYVIKDSNCGYVADAENAKQLSELITEFMSLSDVERKQLGVNSRKYYEEHFSRDGYMDQMEKWLEKFAE